MNDLISSSELTLYLEKYIPTCSELNIISAFVTQPAFIWLQALTKENRPVINLIGRFSPQDFLSGASDIKTVKQCLKSGFKVRALINLHAKIYQIDSDIIFTGSANFTGKGLALVEEGNLESCCEVSPCLKSKTFINKIIGSSIVLTEKMIEEMGEFLEPFICSSEKVEIPKTWPEDIMPKITDIFVTDFPLSKPGKPDKTYDVNPSLEFAIIEQHNSSFDLSKKLFKNSKAYQWILQLVKDNKNNRDLGFGQISTFMHDVLCDDPAPYRRDIKKLQANLYEYVTLYAFDELEIYVPGRRSQILRLIK